MARKVIKFSLDEKSIDRAIKELQAYKKEFERKCNLLVKTLTENGVEIAKMKVKELGAIDTGELHNSIEGFFPSSNVGIIRAGATYAVYVEFGTGVVGKGSPHPDPQGYQYDKNNHGDIGWLYYDERKGIYRWTKGFRSRPFMYNTAKELERKCIEIAKEVFGK